MGRALLGRTQLVSEVQWLLSSTSSLACERQRVALQALWRGPEGGGGLQEWAEEGKNKFSVSGLELPADLESTLKFYGISGLLPD